MVAVSSRGDEVEGKAGPHRQGPAIEGWRTACTGHEVKEQRHLNHRRRMGEGMDVIQQSPFLQALHQSWRGRPEPLAYLLDELFDVGWQGQRRQGTREITR